LGQHDNGFCLELAINFEHKHTTHTIQYFLGQETNLNQLTSNQNSKFKANSKVLARSQDPEVNMLDFAIGITSQLNSRIAPLALNFIESIMFLNFTCSQERILGKQETQLKQIKIKPNYSHS